MNDPLEKAAAKPAPTLGEGCLSRYDLEQLDAEAGTEFPGAAELWRATHPQEAENVTTLAQKAEGPPAEASTGATLKSAD